MRVHLSAPFVKTTCFERHDFLNKKKLVILGIKENVFNINELFHTLLPVFTLESEGTNKMMSLRSSSNDLPLI